MNYFHLFLLCFIFIISNTKAQNTENCSPNFKTHIFLNYDNSEHHIQNMKGKQIIYTCISAYLKNVENVAKCAVNFYDEVANSETTNKNFIFIVVLFDNVRSNHLDGVYETYDLYQKIIKNMKIKSKRVFFTFEGGDGRQFSDGMNFIPFFHGGFSLDKDGNVCCWTDKKRAKDTCVTPEIMKVFKDFSHIFNGLEEEVDKKTNLYDFIKK